MKLATSTLTIIDYVVIDFVQCSATLCTGTAASTFTFCAFFTCNNDIGNKYKRSLVKGFKKTTSFRQTELLSSTDKNVFIR